MFGLVWIDLHATHRVFDEIIPPGAVIVMIMVAIIPVIGVVAVIVAHADDILAIDD